MAVLEGEGRKMLREFDNRRALNHELACLMACAVNAPDKMPEFTPIGAEQEAEGPAVTSAADLVRAEGYLMALAMRGA